MITILLVQIIFSVHQIFIVQDIRMAPSAQAISPSTSSCIYLTKKKLDVFLSFRGEDTRNSIISHLYSALCNKGFKVFKDDEELKRGEVISKELLQAIEDSHFAIVVLSKNYASSSWCLNELQHILYSRHNLCLQVFPIFYDVDPSDVRNQAGSFAEAFSRHEMLQRDNKVMEGWRSSLTEVAGLSGWSCKDRPEVELIDTVVEELWTNLRDRLPPYSEVLIGIDNKIQQLEPLLEMGLEDVRFVGIWGLPGVGKTTIARAIFEKYRSQFEISCFLHNVRTTSERDGEVQLQSKLLSYLKIRKMEIKNTYDGKEIIQNHFRNEKILLILDDVSHPSHFENLANSPEWFGDGSRVIITARDLRLLHSRVHQEYVHEVKVMNKDESLKLFCQKAFKRSEIQDDLLELSKSICEYAGGLPLALSVLGSYFCGSSVSEWKDTLDMLKEYPHPDIFRVLKISFDALTNTEQTIFLDIACFFNGWSKKVITQILESCGLHAKYGITTLHKKSMLKDYDDYVVMHDLLEQMGRRIVVDKSLKDVGNCSRLWSKEVIDEVMENNLGTKEIQCMVSSTSCEGDWDPEAFSTLRGLRLLIVSSSDFNLPRGLKCLSHALKVLHWTKYPLDILPSRTRLHQLVDLRMRHSKLEKLWNKSLCSKKLKILDLSYSKKLIETPDFSELPNLETIELEGCENIVDLHASIGQHKKLQVLNLKSCKKLRARSPKKLEMPALKEFVLYGCIQVKFLPEFGESMKDLERLDVGETNLVKLSESLGLLTGLETLKLRGCKNLVCLPQSICNLKRLLIVDIAGCLKFDRLPEKLNEMEALEEIDVSETSITEVPSSIGGLRKLKKLSFSRCKRLTSNSWGFILPLNCMFWGHSIHEGFTFPASIFNLKSLKELDLSYSYIHDGSIPDDLGGLSSLQKLDLSGNMMNNLPSSFISNLLNLKFLCLNSCSKLRSLPRPPPSLSVMDAGECASLETVADEQLLHLYASIDQAKRLGQGNTLSITIPGSEIPSWFENQNDLFLDGEGETVMMIDIPPCEEMLGIGLCIVLDDKFYSTDQQPGKKQKNSPMWQFDFAAVSAPRGWLVLRPGHERNYEKEIKSSHLWIVFWKQREELSDTLQLRKYSQIPLTFTVRNRKLDANASIKCGWRVMRKADFENSSNLMSQLLPTFERHRDQVVRIPMPRRQLLSRFYPFQRPSGEIVFMLPHPETGEPLCYATSKSLRDRLQQRNSVVSFLETNVNIDR